MNTDTLMCTSQLAKVIGLSNSSVADSMSPAMRFISPTFRHHNSGCVANQEHTSVHASLCLNTSRELVL